MTIYIILLQYSIVILDAVFISVLVYKDVKFTALLFPIIYFINVCSVTCSSGQWIMLYILYLQMISYVGENFPTSYDQVGKYVSDILPCKHISLFHYFSCISLIASSACIFHMISACILEQLHWVLIHLDIFQFV